jgi:hypothetical protein
MTTNPESLFAIIPWLGGACFCGFLPLCFAAILFFTSRKRGQVGSAVSTAPKTTIAALGTGSGLVRMQGKIAPLANGIDGAPENALVYLRLKIEIYEVVSSSPSSNSSGWKDLKIKVHSVPFQLDDGSGVVWVNPEGLDNQLIGNGITPTDEQVGTACTLLGMSRDMLHGHLRFTLWELRAGQTVTVVGSPSEGQNGLEIAKTQGQTFIVSPLLGQAVDASISSQTKKSQVWTLLLSIPGALFLLCGLGGALYSLVTALMGK